MRLSRQRWLVGGALFAALLAVAGTFALADRSLPAPLPIQIDARPIPAFDNRDSAQLRFGDLQFTRNLAFDAVRDLRQRLCCVLAGVASLLVGGDIGHPSAKQQHRNGRRQNKCRERPDGVIAAAGTREQPVTQPRDPGSAHVFLAAEH